MTDISVITPVDKDNQMWSLDFDIIDGEPVYLRAEYQNNDQRASIAAYTVQGTIPGMREYGINWGDIYTNDTEVNLVDVDNQIKQAIQGVTDITNGVGTTYVPQYDNTEKGIEFTIRRAEVTQ